MKLLRLPVGPLQANCYLLIADGLAVVVDPGEDAPAIAEQLARHEAELGAVWLTHAHFDHVGGLADLLAAQPAGRQVPVYLHGADLPLLENAQASAARYGLTIKAPPTSFTPLAHGQQLACGGVAAVCLHTPGHAPGHIAFHLVTERAVLSGDALFRGSVGRTDTPYGDHEQLIESIKRELLRLDDETLVLPGHGPETTVGEELRHNPFLQQGGD